MTAATAPTSGHPSWNIPGNPIFRRYCRSRLRPRGAGISLLITLLVAGFITAVAVTGGARTGLTPSDSARAAVIPLLAFQCLILFVLGTAQAAGGMTAERDEGVIDYQRLIPMSPLAKITGYLFGLPVREYVMVLVTLPFTAWALWSGGIAPSVWAPLYLAVLSSTLLYHLTGLLTGTVAKNRRWAFLVTIGLVFCLYTIIPRLADFGLVFFKYLTIGPVFTESLPHLLPAAAGKVVGIGQQLTPIAKFFDLDLSEIVFSLFSQGGLILTFIVMLCRKWRRTEAHLLGKAWAAGFFIWIQALLLGNSLPLISPGTLFPSRGFTRMTGILPDWAPTAQEAVLLSGIYGLATLLLIFALATMITPARDTQFRGWRRAHKLGKTSLPPLGDSSTAFWAVLVMALAGAAGWFLFSRAMVESRWFPGHQLGLGTLALFALLMASAATAYQALLEAMGGRVVSVVAIAVGVVPLMVGAILGIISTDLVPTALRINGISPAALPIFASQTLLPISELSKSTSSAVPQAFYLGITATSVAAIALLARLWSSRRRISRQVLPPSEI